MTVSGETNVIFSAIKEFYIMVLNNELNVMKMEIVESEIYWWFQLNSDG